MSFVTLHFSGPLDRSVNNKETLSEMVYKPHRIGNTADAETQQSD